MTHETLGGLWQAAAVLLGFQIAAFSWRISREFKMEDAGEPTWFPMPDWLNLLSMLVTVLGVFIGPILGLIETNDAERWFGLGLVIFLGYPLVVAGHYNLFRSGERPRPPRTGQEQIALMILSVAVIVYLATWYFTRT